MHHLTCRIAHTVAVVTPVVEHCLERKIAKWIHQVGLIRRPGHHELIFYHCFTLIIPLQINMLYFPLLVVEFTQFSI